MIRSPPRLRWYLLIEPSPVSWAKPPSAAPPFNASIAFADIDPKLIADTFNSAMS